MPIYAPSLAPRPAPGQGQPAALVLLRFDLRRVLRQRLGKFFGFLFAAILMGLCLQLYLKHLVAGRGALEALRPLADAYLPQGARFQAGLLNEGMIAILWLQAAMVGGGLVARDTLHRIRPLIYAHPVRQRDYLLAKGLFATGLPLAVMLAYIFLPWGLSLAVAGGSGPVWPTAPLYLVPAALAIAALMGAVTLGASALAGSPRSGFGWALGIMLGSSALSFILAGALGSPGWLALGLGNLTKAWPGLVLGVAGEGPGPVPVLLGTGFHLALWIAVARHRTRPDGAVL